MSGQQDGDDVRRQQRQAAFIRRQGELREQLTGNAFVLCLFEVRENGSGGGWCVHRVVLFGVLTLPEDVERLEIRQEDMREHLSRSIVLSDTIVVSVPDREVADHYADHFHHLDDTQARIACMQETLLVNREACRRWAEGDDPVDAAGVLRPELLLREVCGCGVMSYVPFLSDSGPVCEACGRKLM